jgi:hypothetical protein
VVPTAVTLCSTVPWIGSDGDGGVAVVMASLLIRSSSAASGIGFAK